MAWTDRRGGCSSPVRTLWLVATVTAGQVAAAVVHALLQLQAADEATQRQMEAEAKRKQKVGLGWLLVCG